MPQAAYVRCNCLAISISILLYGFQCRKRHMFVATGIWKRGVWTRTQFQCRKRHMFVATFHISTWLEGGSAVSMPQAAYVRCNIGYKGKDAQETYSFNAASGICSLQHSEALHLCQHLAGFQCRKRLMFVATNTDIVFIKEIKGFQCRKRHMFVATSAS